MKDHIEPEKVLVQNPQPVKVAAFTAGQNIRAILFSIVLLVALAMVFPSVARKFVANTTSAETLPIYTFESSETCATYTPETCPDCTWLSRFVGELDALAESPLEIRDVLHRAYVESRFDNQAVSTTGDWGICQINAKTHPEVIVQRLLTDPEYAAFQCLKVYRAAYKACGKRWECCYRYGIKGCEQRRFKP